MSRRHQAADISSYQHGVTRMLKELLAVGCSVGFIKGFYLGLSKGNPSASDGPLFNIYNRQLYQGYNYQQFKVALKRQPKFSTVTHEIFTLHL